MGSRGWNGATVVLTPVFEKGEYSATVNVKDAGKGTAGAFSIGGETYRLAAMGADGYAFDHWLAGESSYPIYENPYTVTLTANTNLYRLLPGAPRSHSECRDERNGRIYFMKILPAARISTP